VKLNMVNSKRKNINRGYRKLRVWEDAIDYYVLTCKLFLNFPFELKKVASEQIASFDSIHRNIAAGYCRRTINEYLQFLNIALSSTGESVSGLHAYVAANQITNEDYERADTLAFKLEIGLKRLIQSLQEKREKQDWNDSFIVNESNIAYEEKITNQ